jgi:hypothetical protein
MNKKKKLSERNEINKWSWSNTYLVKNVVN